MLEVDWEPSSPPIADPAEPDVPAQKPKASDHKPAVVDVDPTELPITQPPRRIGAYIAGAVIAVGAYAAWSMFIRGPAQPETAPTVTEQPRPSKDSQPSARADQLPRAPAPPTAIDRRLAQAQQCLQAGDYGCSWRAVRSILQLEPKNDAALSIEDEIHIYVDRKVADFEQALQTMELADARAALADAEKAKNFDHSDPRLEEMSRRLLESEQAEQRSASEVPAAAPTTGTSVTAPDPLVQELLSEAQQSLDRGDLNAAESLANKVLNRDAANAVAPEILRRVETEKERIKAILKGSTEVKEAVKVNR